MARVQLPANLRMLVGKYGALELEGQTVGELVRNLVGQYPELQNQLFGSNGQLHSYVNIFVDQQNIRELRQLDTPVEPQQTVLVLTALAGG